MQHATAKYLNAFFFKFATKNDYLQQFNHGGHGFRIYIFANNYISILN